MKNKTKLKPVKWGSIIALMIIIFAVLGSAAVIMETALDRQTELKVYGFVYLGFILINLLIWLKTRSLIPLSLILINIIMSLSYFFNYKGVWMIIAVVLLFSLYFFILFKDIKYNSHYRHILELAARPVKGTADGFTPRPLPTGKCKFTRQELLDFAGFLKKHWIAIPYIDNKRVMLAIKDQSRFWFGRPVEAKDSYISFYYNGDVTVNIAKKDYAKYRDELTFDRLCQSMADLFKTYLDKYRTGKTDEILQHIKKGS